MKLFYEENFHWLQIPNWAEFFIELGKVIALEPLQTTRTIIGLSIPTRAFSAGLTATGIVEAHAAKRNAGSSDSHFEYLCELPEGTQVQCLDGKRQKTFLLRGCVEMGGEPRLVIQMSNPKDGNQKRFVSKKFCHEIQVLDLTAKQAPTGDLPKHQKGRQIHQISSFASEFLQDQTATSFLLKSSLDFLIVGRGSLLRREFTETSFAVREENAENFAGNLQDILRIKQFFNTDQPYRGEFLTSDMRRKSLERYLPVTAPIVIFDGANGFLKLREYCRRSHWIVLLDRTENSFEPAIEQFNQDYIHRDDDSPLANLPVFPAGIEVMTYQEKVR